MPNRPSIGRLSPLPMPIAKRLRFASDADPGGLASLRVGGKRRRGEEDASPQEPPFKWRLREQIRAEAWQVAQWNMRGSSSGRTSSITPSIESELKNYMQLPHMKAICLQECGSLFEMNKGAEDGGVRTGVIAGQQNWHYAYVEWQVTRQNRTRNNNRCSLAVLFRSLTPTRFRIVQPYSNRQRPLLGIDIGANTWVYTAHAPSSSGNRPSTSNQSYVSETVERLLLEQRQGNGGFVLAADLNVVPSMMGEELERKGAHIVYPANKAGVPVPTHQSGNTLDWQIYAGPMTPQSIQYRPRYNNSDHNSLVVEYQKIKP